MVPHCERTYERGKWRTIDGFQMCPYIDCDGDAVIDAIDWAEIRDANPTYAERPCGALGTHGNRTTNSLRGILKQEVFP